MEANKQVYVIINLIITTVIFSIFVLPKYQESSNIETKLIKDQYQYESRVNYYANISDVLNKIEKNKDALEKIDSALPSEFSLAPVVYFFENTAEESGLAVRSITFSKQQIVSKSSANENIKNILFRVDLSGSYDGLKKFLYSLEESSRIFEVSSISFSAGQVSKSNVLKSYDFSLSVKTQTY